MSSKTGLFVHIQERNKKEGTKIKKKLNHKTHGLLIYCY